MFEIFGDMKNTAAIILAGGNSSRMNYPKAWLMYNNELTFLESIVNSYIEIGIRPIVVLNEIFTNNQWQPFFESILKKAIVIKNGYPEKGRLYSLVLGLGELTTENALFIHNVDQPFIEKEVLSQLHKNIEPNGITLPCTNGKNGHPVLIGKPIINEIKNHYSDYPTLKDIWKFFPKKKIEVNNENILTNINTPEEYESCKESIQTLQKISYKGGTK